MDCRLSLHCVRYRRQTDALDICWGKGDVVRDELVRTPAKRAQTVCLDADLTLFDPLTVLDQATYTLLARTSAAIVHVRVGGQFVVRDGEVLADTFPGQAIRATQFKSHER